MAIFWAIELYPLHGRGKSWIYSDSIKRTRKQAWEAIRGAGCTEEWRKTVAFRRREGYMRAVKVAVEKIPS